MTWATPFGSEVAQVRSPGSLHNRWCCDPELKPPGYTELTPQLPCEPLAAPPPCSLATNALYSSGVSLPSALPSA
ncbi:hypothetical protein BRN52_03330 [Xanthomonas oryzae pv. oryzae]|nr:hypothetical protein BRN52_03330 [Xanthomonas oryzae pv. oryzae]